MAQIVNSVDNNFSFQVGQHGLLDLYGVEQTIARDQARISEYLIEAANIAQATILKSHFHSFGGHGGVTGVLLLSESHMSIHTWPEYNFVAIDIFMCGQHQIEPAVSYLQKVFAPEKVDFQLCERGRAL